MNRFGKLLTYAWAISFTLYLAVKAWLGSGGKLPAFLVAYHAQYDVILESFLSSWLFLPIFLAGYVLVLTELGKESGWNKLYSAFPAAKRVISALHAGTGKVSQVRYQGTLQVFVSSFGVYMKVPVFFRPGHPSIEIPWSAIETVEMQRTPSSRQSLFNHLAAKISRSVYARIALKSFPEFTLVLPWRQEFTSSVPSTVRVMNRL